MLALLAIVALSDPSPLQQRIDAATSGSVIEVHGGTYTGDLVIDKSVQLIGHDRPLIVGSGRGTVIHVRADGVVIDGFDIDGREGGSVADDSAGIHVAGRSVRIRNCRIQRSPFGIYLYQADGARIEHNVVKGIPGRDPGDQGSAIHLWNTNDFALVDNDVRDSRDGFYLQNSSRGLVARNVAAYVRYGLHYMFSDDNVFEDNRFEQSAAGAALMFSKRLVFRHNRFLHNRGFASVGLLMQGCDDVRAEENLIDDNARGVFLEGSHRNVFTGNVIADSDVAIVLYASAENTRFEGNLFAGNLSPLQLVGRRTDTVFDRNFWDSDEDPDLDGDGIRDRPYRLANVFDHLRGNLTAADLFAQGLGAAILARAERTFPVLQPVAAADARPLARPPDVSRVPAQERASAESDAWGLAGSILLIAGACTVIVYGLRRRRTSRLA